ERVLQAGAQPQAARRHRGWFRSWSYSVYRSAREPRGKDRERLRGMMAGMRRLLFTLLSAVLCLATALLWVWSYQQSAQVACEQRGLIADVELSYGHVWCRWLRFDSDYPYWTGLSCQSGSPVSFTPLPAHLAGFGYS